MSPHYVLYRILDKTKRVGDCLLWTAGLSTGGYPKFKLLAVTYQTHRWMLELKLGRPIKNGYECCHSCDNPICLEWDHLWEGTRADNMKDAGNKGRMGNFFASKTHCPKGHEYIPSNTRTYKGSRSCITCAREYSKLYHKTRAKA